MRSDDSIEPPEPGEPVVLNGRYELRELIGRGGMAEVHRAVDRVLSREVAVKLMHHALVGEVDRHRFASETRVLAQMNDPHLVTIWDAGVDETHQPPRPWLVMELLTGPTLAARIAEGPLEPAEVAAIGAGLAAGLAHVHALGVVHRDVKPANVLHTGSGVAKLADFGVARMAGDRGELTQTGHTIGTAAYLAPEQVRDETLTGASDVYALGLVLLEALTGLRAYSGSPIEAALARLHHGPAIPVSLGAGWIRVLEEMTAPDPSQRPPAAAVAERLSALTPRATAASLTRTSRAPGPSVVGAAADADTQIGMADVAATESIASVRAPRRRPLGRLGSRARAAAVAATLAVAGVGLWAALGSGGSATTPADAAATTAHQVRPTGAPGSGSTAGAGRTRAPEASSTPTAPASAVPVLASPPTSAASAPLIHHAGASVNHRRPHHPAPHHHQKHHHKHKHKHHGRHHHRHHHR